MVDGFRCCPRFPPSLDSVHRIAVRLVIVAIEQVTCAVVLLAQLREMIERRCLRFEPRKLAT